MLTLTFKPWTFQLLTSSSPIWGLVLGNPSACVITHTLQVRASFARTEIPGPTRTYLDLPGPTCVSFVLHIFRIVFSMQLFMRFGLQNGPQISSFGFPLCHFGHLKSIRKSTSFPNVKKVTHGGQNVSISDPPTFIFALKTCIKT